MRTSLIALTLLAAPLASSLAFADDAPAIAPAEAMTLITAGTAPCDAVGALPNSPVGGDKRTCKKLSTQKLAGIGRAELYAMSIGKDWTRYAVAVFADDGSASLSMPVDLVMDCAMGGKCDVPGKQTPTLRTISVGGQPAVALELQAAMDHVQYSMESSKIPATHSPWKQTSFVVCGHGTSAMACVTATYGTRFQACSASLDATGALTHRCDETTNLAFGN